MIPREQWIRGYLADGRKLPLERVNRIRQASGYAPLEQIEVLNGDSRKPTGTPTRPTSLPIIVSSAPRVNTLPGDCLGEVLSNLGFQTARGCGCKDRKSQMNVWGIDGCRSNTETIVAWLREQGESASWFAMAKAAVNAATHGYFINPADPYRSIVEISLQLAERRQATTGE
jgi:hypothetical protein